MSTEKLTQARWEAECLLMHNVLPQFQPSYENGMLRFRGCFKGRRTGRIYEVLIQAPRDKYPQIEPAIYMEPHAEPHHWIGDGRLCYQRDQHVWDPSRGTFANTLSIAIKYLAEFD